MGKGQGGNDPEVPGQEDEATNRRGVEGGSLRKLEELSEL